MKIIQTGLLCLLLTVVSVGQNYLLKGTFAFDGNSSEGKSILAHRFLDEGKKLLLVGSKRTDIWDLENNKLISSNNFEVDVNSDIKPGALSPDGGKILDLSRPVDNGKLTWAGRRITSFTPASVFDTHTGKKIFAFDKTVLDGAWSENGKILITFHNPGKTTVLGGPGPETEISVWDGESLTFKYSLKFADGYLWRYLTPDGSRLFTIATSGDKKLRDKITVWNAATGKIEKVLAADPAYFFPNFFIVSKHDKYIGVIARNRNNSKDTLVYFWETSDSQLQTHTIKPDKKISGSFTFSPDEEFMATDTEDTLKIFQIATGKQTSEVINNSLPSYWLAGNKIFLYDMVRKMKGISVPENRIAFEEKLTVSETTSKSVTGDYENSTTVDQTFIDPAPGNDKFITHSNLALQIRDALTGAELQTITNVQIKKGAYFTGERVGWAENGRLIYVLEGQNEVISIWEER